MTFILVLAQMEQAVIETNGKENSVWMSRAAKQEFNGYYGNPLLHSSGIEIVALGKLTS